MATRTIETRAIISAQDRTGNTFEAVSRKVRGLETTAAGAQKRLDAVARGMGAAAGYIAPPVPPGDPVGAIDGMILSLATSRSVWTSPRATADALERIAKIVRAQDAGAGRS